MEKVLESNKRKREYCTSNYVGVLLLSGYSVFFMGISISLRHFMSIELMSKWRSLRYFETSRRIVMTISIKEGEN